jgi:hypothetical protein
MKKGLTASSARIVLALFLLIILAAMVAGSYFAYSFLSTTSKEVADMQTEASAVDMKIQNLLKLKDQLEKNPVATKKAEQIVADSKSYQYQNQIVNDLSIYAGKANVPIQSFTFQDGSTSSKSSSSSSQTTAKKPTSVSGVKSITVSIQLGDKVPYNNLLHFLYLVENNVTRMQIYGVSISRGEQRGEVSAQSLELGVYVR